MYSVDFGTGETVVPIEIGVSVDDVTIDASAEDPVVDEAFW